MRLWRCPGTAEMRVSASWKGWKALHCSASLQASHGALEGSAPFVGRVMERVSPTSRVEVNQVTGAREGQGIFNLVAVACLVLPCGLYRL